MNNKITKETKVEIHCGRQIKIVHQNNQGCIYRDNKNVSIDQPPATITRAMINEMVNQEKRYQQLRKEYKENTVDKSTLWPVFLVTVCSVLGGFCLSYYYNQQGWENYYWAGFLTVGVIVPILILATVKVTDWLNCRTVSKR